MRPGGNGVTGKTTTSPSLTEHSVTSRGLFIYMILISSQTITLRVGKESNIITWLLLATLIIRKSKKRLAKGMWKWGPGHSLWPNLVIHILGGQQFGDVYEKSYMLTSWSQLSASWGHPQEMIPNSEKTCRTGKCPLNNFVLMKN